jgi:hypothetical protein
MTGYDLMTVEQRHEWENLEERRTHSSTMAFSGLDAAVLAEYEALAGRLKAEYRHERQLIV